MKFIPFFLLFYFEQSNLAEITYTNEKFQTKWSTILIENIMDSD